MGSVQRRGRLWLHGCFHSCGFTITEAQGADRGRARLSSPCACAVMVCITLVAPKKTLSTQIPLSIDLRRVPHSSSTVGASAVMVNRISPSSRAMKPWMTRQASCGDTRQLGSEQRCATTTCSESCSGRTNSSVAGVVAPWLMGNRFRPSSSYR